MLLKSFRLKIMSSSNGWGGPGESDSSVHKGVFFTLNIIKDIAEVTACSV